MQAVDFNRLFLYTKIPGQSGDDVVKYVSR